MNWKKCNFKYKDKDGWTDLCMLPGNILNHKCDEENCIFMKMETVYSDDQK